VRALPRVPLHDLSHRVDPDVAVLARDLRLKEESRQQAIDVSLRTSNRGCAPAPRPATRNHR
jgi:hypothetical protein